MKLFSNETLYKFICSRLSLICCSVLGLFNYFLLLFMLIGLYYELTMDVDHEIRTYGIHPGVAVFMIAGLGAGELISLIATVLTYMFMKRKGFIGRLLIFGIHFELTIFFIYSLI